MQALIVVAVAAATWLGVLVVVVSLCRAAQAGDRGRTLRERARAPG